LESFFELPAENGTVVKILQITDTHLFGTPNGTLLGINTNDSFQAVLDAIKRQSIDYDLIVATGDLAQDHSNAAYQCFAEGINSLPAPCVWLPGNHDFQPAMVDVLAQSGIIPAKDGLLGKDWYLILLDSQVLGSPHGELSDYQLEWLDRKLAEHADRQALILLHHHPIDSGCNWLDQHRLRNSHMLAAVLNKYPNANTLICGHIHQELDLDWNGKRLLTTPSTCIQFKPHCTNFTLDSVAPGWRYLELYPDGTVKTTVYRLQTKEFIPNMDADGY
jgi:Icc protein